MISGRYLFVGNINRHIFKFIHDTSFLCLNAEHISFGLNRRRFFNQTTTKMISGRCLFVGNINRSFLQVYSCCKFSMLER